MRLVESRTTLIITYIVLGVGAFIALFPMALLVLNSLKAAEEIVLNPLSTACSSFAGITSRALGPTLTSAKRC